MDKRTIRIPAASAIYAIIEKLYTPKASGSVDLNKESKFLEISRIY